MRLLKEKEKREAIDWMHQTVQIAQHSSCGRARCGSIIVKDNHVVGTGFNSPPQGKDTQRKCNLEKDMFHKKITDKTCCVHAEQRAIMDALEKNPTALVGARLYFIRLDDVGEISFTGKPYCTICSKMALDVGISEFVLWHQEGITVYDTDEYNLLSFDYR